MGMAPYFLSAIVEEEVMVRKENKRAKSKGEIKTAKKAYKNVEFAFYSPEAMNVYVAGEFNGWDHQSLPMKKDKDGIWRLKVKLLPGRYEYKFFADNAWIENLPNAEAIPNPFGTQNFVITVE
jgi:1,4-alpha-glucan branching enzyme